MLFYVNPAILESLFGALIVTLILRFFSNPVHIDIEKDYLKFEESERNRREDKQSGKKGNNPNKSFEFKFEPKKFNTGMFMLIFFLLLMILLPIQYLYTPLYLSHSLKTHKITELPEVDPSIVRIVPKVVSEKYAMDALQFPRYTIDSGSIVFINGTPYWGYGLIPEGLINTFVLKDKGALYVDMSSFGKKTTIVEKSMNVGEGMLLTDWYLWHIYNKYYLIDCGNPYFVSYNKELYLVTPVIGYEFHWKFPTFYTVPKWEGVMLINSSGNLKFLPIKQAESCKILHEQKLFPASLVRLYVYSFNYIHGILNVILYHKEQFKIADVPGQSNQQPFLVATKNGLKWIVACEPYGQSYGIFRIYVVDARSGTIQVYQPSNTKALIGPVRSLDYVKQAMPKVDWQSMKAVEPIPVIVNGTLYWQVRIIPSDASGIAYIAMVNSENPNDVIILRSYSRVKSFLEIGEKVKISGLNKTKNSKAFYYIIIKSGGNIVDKIPVYKNQSVEIVSSVNS